MKQYRRILPLLILFVLSSFAHAQNTIDDSNLPNFYQVNANLYRGGQPTEAGIKKLAQMGVKTIINLRGEGELSRWEKSWAQNAGIKFIPISLSNWNKPKSLQINDVLKEIDKSVSQPIFIHCKRGADRTGTVIAAYRISHDGWTAKEANAEAKKFGFGWWQFQMKDFINDYYDDYRKSK